MLATNRRLKSPALFKRTLNGKRLCSNGLFAVYALPRLPGQAQTTQFGLIVSRKVDKRAVRRNRIKRHLREVTRAYLKLPESAGLCQRFRAIIIIARSGLLTSPYAETHQRLFACYKG